VNNCFAEGPEISDGGGSAHLRHKSIIMATLLVLETRFPAHDNRSIDIAVDLAGIPDEH
jgi:hypothetical protein